uniref:Transposase n=1 Tax=Macrostomum lignano TaxID=282301 RepID=A0A1I8FC44_9PLAT
VAPDARLSIPGTPPPKPSDIAGPGAQAPLSRICFPNGGPLMSSYALRNDKEQKLLKPLPLRRQSQKVKKTATSKSATLRTGGYRTRPPPAPPAIIVRRILRWQFPLSPIDPEISWIARCSVGYIQGFCDLLAPLLDRARGRGLTLACFEKLMLRMVANFNRRSRTARETDNVGRCAGSGRCRSGGCRASGSERTRQLPEAAARFATMTSSWCGRRFGRQAAPGVQPLQHLCCRRFAAGVPGSFIMENDMNLADVTMFI